MRSTGQRLLRIGQDLSRLRLGLTVRGDTGSPTWIVIASYAAMGIFGTVRSRNHDYAEGLGETH
jgi:hypothetical protein